MQDASTRLIDELPDELEKDDTEIPEIITILPPENANADCDTDEDSGDEDLVVLNNLPGPQLTAEAEIQIKPSVEQWDSEDDKPLSFFIERKPNQIKQFQYRKCDLEVSGFPDWKDVLSVRNNISPATTFKLFFVNEIIHKICDFTNTYTMQIKRVGDVTEAELLCFIGILLLSGYAPLPQNSMFWQNRDDK
ncbi:Transposase IS4 [Popillia japonica]|uniref:Transposase IS4 n=1 Tax=Popillia japonica TaxID=7064 RepID=A0AAW1N1P4_POPJA